MNTIPTMPSEGDSKEQWDKYYDDMNKLLSEQVKKWDELITKAKELKL